MGAAPETVGDAVPTEGGQAGSAPRVSVIVATYNRERYIDECLQSMLAQTRPADEILVVDDGSTDGTAARVACYGPPVRLLRKANGGKSTALNLGLSEASGDWVWLFDDDDVALPDALQRMLQALAQEPGADFAYSAQIIGRDGTGGRIEPLHETPLPAVGSQGLFLHTLKCFPFRMQGMLMRKRTVQAVGGFDPAYARSQDYEFYTRLLQRARGVPLSRPTFVWRVHEGPRGPGHAAHQGAQRDDVWRRYDARFALALRDSLPLGRYLVPPRLDAALPPHERQWALVERALVMASKGLIREMALDLHEADAIGASHGHPVLPEWLAKEVSEAANFPAFRQSVVNDAAGLLQALDGAGHGRLARALQRRLARGLWWAWRHAPLDRAERERVRRVMLVLLLRSLRP